MQPNFALRSLILAAALLAAAACQKPEPAPAPAAASSGASAPTPPAAPAAPPAPKVQVCTLLSAAEVSAIVGKKLIQDGCTYGLDTTEQQKALAENQAQLGAAQKRAQAGDMSGFMKGMMQAGAGQQKAGNAMMNQASLTVEASRDDQTEDAVKAIYAKTGATVRGAIAPLAPEQRGVNGLIEGLDEVSGVGDWAFATNVAAVNMGMGFSTRGRILEARKGPWHVTVSATVAPDPGAAALDRQMAGVARALIAKL
jgi:hypothetical protein